MVVQPTSQSSQTVENPYTFEQYGRKSRDFDDNIDMVESECCSPSPSLSPGRQPRKKHTHNAEALRLGVDTSWAGTDFECAGKDEGVAVAVVPVGAASLEEDLDSIRALAPPQGKSNTSVYIPANLSPELLASWPAPLQEKIRPAIRAAASSRREMASVSKSKMQALGMKSSNTVTIPSVGPDRFLSFLK